MTEQNTCKTESEQSATARKEGKTLSSYNLIPKQGQTRECYDPWTFMQILSNTGIRPCCFTELEIGSVKAEKGGIEGALNSDVAINLRKGLLTGNLDQWCAVCSYKPMIDVASFQNKIRKLVES